VAQQPVLSVTKPSHRIGWLAGLCLAAGLQLSGCANAPAASAGLPQVQPTVPLVESEFGIRIDGLRLSAAGSMLDFRYRVLDPEKAALILNGKVQPYLQDSTHNAKLGVPDTPVLGRLRQTARNDNILMDRTYFIMFGNPGKALHSGDKVTLLLDKVRITELTVQ
jgi:hypothetical protein